MDKLTGQIIRKLDVTGQVILPQRLPIYGGEYEITPSVNSQSLDTKNKLLKEDIYIDAIPYSEVTNKSGGVTATIGFE